MDRLKKYMPPLLILILFVSLVVSFRSFLMINIIEPIALMCWAVWRIVSSVDQNALWIILIVFCSILFIYLFLSGKDNITSSAYHDTYNSLNRVDYWRTQIKNAALGKKENDELRDNLKELLITVIVREERSDSTDLEEIVEKGQVSLSLAAHQFLFSPKGKREIFSITHQLKAILLAPRWLRKWTMKLIRQDNTSIDEIIRLMEAELEISYE